MVQETTFYYELQVHPELDLRDNRGKRLDLALVLLGVILGLLRYRDGTLSSLHRSMVNLHGKLCAALDIDNERVISRSHLPRILAKVNGVAFEQLLLKYVGISLDDEQKRWFAGDGKELRGSISKGDKRGEALVEIVTHEDKAVIGQAFYNGTKESEKPCLQQLIEQRGLQSQCITADALHLCPAMTEPIEQAGGVFIIGLKNNQKELRQDMIDHTEAFPSIAKHQTVDKGHGRLEIRRYACFDVSGEYFEARWNKTSFRSLIKVQRTRIILKTNQSSEETAYYLSNGNAKNADEYFKAIRNHWSIEVNNHYRDVSLKEDKLRTKTKAVTRMLASIRTLILELFRRWKPSNVVAQMQLFQDNFDELIDALKEIKFL